MAGDRCPPTQLKTIRVRSSSESKAQFELDVAFRARTGSGYNAEVGVLAIVIKPARIGKLRRVSEVERFGPELHPEPLGNEEILENREVELPGRASSVALQTEVATG